MNAKLKFHIFCFCYHGVKLEAVISCFTKLGSILDQFWVGKTTALEKRVTGEFGTLWKNFVLSKVPTSNSII